MTIGGEIALVLSGLIILMLLTLYLTGDQSKMIILDREDAKLTAQIIACYIEENRHHLSETKDDGPQTILDDILYQLDQALKQKSS